MGLSLMLSLSLSLSSLGLLVRHALTPRGCIFLYFLNKTKLQDRAVTLICLRAVTLSESCDTVCLRAVTRSV